MPGPLPLPPPYALAPPSFRFPALAAHLGRAQLGGEREMALACLTAARLASALLPPLSLPVEDRTARAERARYWLSSLAMPQPARMALMRSIDATGGGDAAVAGDLIAEVATYLTGHLDAAASAELVALAAELRGEEGDRGAGAASRVTPCILRG